MSVEAFQLSATLLEVCEGEASPPGTLGGVVSLEPPLTVMLTAAEVVVAFWLSLATAVKLWLPAVALFQVTPYGAVVSTPSDTPPRKNSTLATEPSLSAALALTAMLAPAL